MRCHTSQGFMLFNVLFPSLCRAGGLGLNFVGANVVILFDPTWTRAIELLAIDRYYTDKM